MTSVPLRSSVAPASSTACKCPGIGAIGDQAAHDLLVAERFAGQREAIDHAAEGDAVGVGDARLVLTEGVGLVIRLAKVMVMWALRDSP